MTHLGPVIRRKGGDTKALFLVASFLALENGDPASKNAPDAMMKQVSSHLIKITPSLPADLTNEIPGCPSAEEFGKALIKVQGMQ
jgi:hypothetical protein